MSLKYITIKYLFIKYPYIYEYKREVGNIQAGGTIVLTWPTVQSLCYISEKHRNNIYCKTQWTQ